MRFLRTIVPAILFSAIVLTSGCVAILAGAAGAAGGIVYLKGQLESYESQPFDSVASAIRKTVTQKQFGDTKSTEADGEFSLRGKTSDDAMIWIRAVRKGPSITQLRIRHGVVGDEVRAREILEAIRANY